MRIKEIAMLIVALLLAVYGLVRLVAAAASSLRDLPRSNEDWIWW